MSSQPAKKYEKKEMLILIRNDFLRELCIAEVNMRILKGREILSVDLGMNAEETKGLTHWETMVKNITQSLSIVDQMIESEEKKVVN